MPKSDAYYDELFEDLVKYSEWNPDDMIGDEDLEMQLKDTLKNKYSDGMLQRMRKTKAFEQTIIQNFDTEISRMEDERDIVLTSEEKNRIRQRAVEREALAIEFSREIEARLKPRAVVGFNITAKIKGKPILARETTHMYRGKKVNVLRDNKGRFASRIK